jgi:hypothetical protein
MAEGFRNRGLDVVVDTTSVAEFDIAGHGVPDTDLADIERSLRTVPLSEADRSRGMFQVRRIGEWDVGFVQSREAGVLVVTVGVVEPARADRPLAATLRRIALLATLRGATGV